jgi:hypothetical protein
MLNKPVVDLRIYTTRQRGMAEFLRLQEQEMLPIQLRHIAPPIGYWVTDIGPQDEVIHLWEFDSLADMEARRDARNRDPDWSAYLELTEGLFVHQITSIVRRVKLPSIDALSAAVVAKPLVEFRSLSIKRRRLPEFLRLFETMAAPLLLRHVGAPIGFFASDIGELNELHQLWGYDSLADMEARQTALRAEPEWQTYLDAAAPLIVRQQTRAIRRAPFPSLGLA